MNNELTRFFKDLIDEGSWDMPDCNFGNIVKFNENNEPEILVSESEYYTQLLKIGLVLLDNKYVSDMKKSLLFDKLEYIKLINGNTDEISFKKANYTSPQFQINDGLIPDDKGFFDLSTDPFWVEKLTSPEHWKTLSKIIKDKIVKTILFQRDIIRKKNNKSVSETTSDSIAQRMCEYFGNMESPDSSNLPDIIADNRLKAEVKVAKASGNNTTWRGGALCKRFGSHFLVSWTVDDDLNVKLFVCYVYLTRKDWEDKQQPDYYGPPMSVNNLFNEYEPYIIVGERELSKTGLNRMKLV